MKKIYFSFTSYMKILTRNIWTYIFLIANLLYLLPVTLSFIHKNNAGGALAASAYFSVSGVLFFMVLGYFLSNTEDNNNCSELMATFNDAKASQSFSKIIVIFVTALSVSLLGFLIYFIEYLIYKVDMYFLAPTIKYILLYYFLPFTISGIIGIIIGNLIKSKLAYILLVLIWCFITSINTVIFQLITNFLLIDLKQLGVILNITVSEPHMHYNPLYGLPIEKRRFIFMGIYLFIVLFILTIQNLLQYEKRNKYLKIVIPLFLFIFTSLGWMYKHSSRIIYYDLTSDSIRHYDSGYPPYKQAINSNSYNKINISSYDINLDITKDLSASVTFDINFPNNNISQGSFTLYHNFNITQLNTSQGKDLSFKREGDIVTFYIPDNKEKNLTLNIEYSGFSSPIFYANSNGILLPSFFPWIPQENLFNAYNINNNSLNINYNPKPIHYSLKLNHPKSMYCNIPFIDKGKWEGLSNNGITVMAGDINTITSSNLVMVYPKVFQEQADSLPDYKPQLEKLFGDIIEDLALENKSAEIKNMYSIPIRSTMSNTTIIKNGNEIYIDSNNGFINKTKQVPPRVFLIPLTTALCSEEETLTSQNNLLYSSFLFSYEYWYLYKSNEKKLEYSMFMNMLNASKAMSEDKNNKDDISKRDYEFYSCLNDFFSKHITNEKFMKNFFRDYYKYLSTNPNLTINEVKDFIKSKDR